MYTKQEASQIRKEFWTSFGLYMHPLAGANGESINWLNYKTGIKYLYFRMDADKRNASIGIELKHTDPELRQNYYARLFLLKSLLEEQMGEEWIWEKERSDEDGRMISRISTSLDGVNIFNKTDWPAIISFLKPRMLALDAFWSMAKEMVEG